MKHICVSPVRAQCNFALKKLVHLTLFICLLTGSASAQLSPGDLASAHAKLEGISNCTQCHVLGEKVSNDKCLACHKEIKTRLDARQGYHYSKEVRGKDCASCHSDHHGRNFDMVRFDEKTFNHNLTGYELTGAHKKIDCRDCHKPDNVSDWDLKKRKDTFLGLGQKCLDCHDDFHQKTLSNDCAKCHSTDEFRPATKFNHGNTKFALEGKHKTVDCKDCHQTEIRNGKEFQRFAGVPFGNCTDCHKDAHNNNLGTNCKQCHNEQSFTSTASLGRFNHNGTGFPLKGRHQRVDCKECHQLPATPLTVFQDRNGVKTQDCATCHKDVHEGKFGSNCADCHNENSFRQVGKMEGFNHDLTGFALEGKHEVVDCRKCHISESLTKPLPHNTCAACHTDYHEGQFVSNARSPDCAECHTVDGFEGSTFSIAQHNKTKFPLDGGHVATPCFACHLPDGAEKWQFRNIGERCVDCHDDVHKGEIAATWYPNQACEKCHLTESWTGVNQFDHSKTTFQLLGKHAEVDCRACHMRDEDHPQGKFTGISTECAACHDNVHGRQFEKAGVTDCARCHNFQGWALTDFDHNKTRFKLEGKHAEVACDRCHRPVLMDGAAVVQYRIERFECVDCHQ